MISAETAGAQILRLSGLPCSDGAQKQKLSFDCTAALRECSQSTVHAADIVSGLLRTCRWFPTPADVHQMAAGTRTDEPTEAQDRSPRCEVCQGVRYLTRFHLGRWKGYRQHFKRITEQEYWDIALHRVKAEGTLYTSAEPCVCLPAKEDNQ